MNIAGIDGKYTKFSNNTEKVGKTDKFRSGWTVPLEFNLTIEQYEQAFEQPYFGRAFFDEKKGVQYSAWKNFIVFPVALQVEYENCAFALEFVGGKDVEWEDGCDVDRIDFECVDNGVIKVTCHVYVHPNALQKRLLDEFQHSSVKIDISGGEISSKMKRKQGDMFDAKNADGQNAGQGGTAEVGAGFAGGIASVTGTGVAADRDESGTPEGVGEQFAEDAARKQAEAWQNGRPVNAEAPEGDGASVSH